MRSRVWKKWIAVLCISMFLLSELLLCEKQALAAGAETTELTLTKRKETESAAFHVNNLFPGDAQVNDYRVKVTCEDTARVYFRVDIKRGYEKLAEVLKCRVLLSDTGETLYDGLMKALSETAGREMPVEVKNGQELTYQITVYLDTSVGNEYQNTSLVADFVWWMEAEEHTTADTEDTLPSDQEDGSAPPEVDTGDDAKPLLWLGLSACAVLTLAVLLIERKKGETTHE